MRKIFSYIRSKVFLIIFTLLIGVYGFYKYLETERDTSTVKTENTFSADEISVLMLSKTDNTFYQYVEKAIEVESEIKEITFREGVYTLILKGDSNETSLLCEMQKNQNNIVKGLKIGDIVVVKGVFKGFLNDAIFLHCVII